MYFCIIFYNNFSIITIKLELFNFINNIITKFTNLKLEKICILLYINLSIFIIIQLKVKYLLIIMLLII